MKLKNWKILVIILFVLISGGCYGLQSAGKTEDLETAPSIVMAEAAIPEAEASAPPSEPDEVFCYVHICGAVVKPGVYQIPAGERIFQVVELAGGYTAEAAEEYLNLAAEVTDGLKLVVPTQEELASMGTVMWADGSGQDILSDTRVNLNTATKEQLMTLSGIGEAKADAILKYRKEHQGFSQIEDIMNIPGIKQAAFDKIKEDISI